MAYISVLWVIGVRPNSISIYQFISFPQFFKIALDPYSALLVYYRGGSHLEAVSRRLYDKMSVGEFLKPPRLGRDSSLMAHCRN